MIYLCANWLSLTIAFKIILSLSRRFSDAVDGAGHSSYWGSDIYYEMVKQKDMQVAKILNALSTTKTSSGKPMIDETIVVVVADHGGYKNNHNWTPPFIAEVYVPLLLIGMLN